MVTPSILSVPCPYEFVLISKMGIVAPNREPSDRQSGQPAQMIRMREENHEAHGKKPKVLSHVTVEMSEKPGRMGWESRFPGNYSQTAQQAHRQSGMVCEAFYQLSLQSLPRQNKQCLGGRRTQASRAFEAGAAFTEEKICGCATKREP